jgi:hypothetical protein
MSVKALMAERAWRSSLIEPEPSSTKSMSILRQPSTGRPVVVSRPTSSLGPSSPPVLVPGSTGPVVPVLVAGSVVGEASLSLTLPGPAPVPVVVGVAWVDSPLPGSTQRLLRQTRPVSQAPPLVQGQVTLPTGQVSESALPAVVSPQARPRRNAPNSDVKPSKRMMAG